MIVHKRELTGRILCAATGGPSRANVVSSSHAENVTCRECVKRMGGGGDAAALTMPHDPPPKPLPAMAL